MRLAQLGLVLVSACNSASAKPQVTSSRPSDEPPAADPSKLEGAGLYQTFCAQCHGADAKGYKVDNAPSLVNPTFLESATDDFVHRSIFAGRPSRA